MEYSTYELGSGKILSHGSTCYDEPAMPEPELYGWIAGKHDSATKFVSDGIVSDRPTLTVSATPLTIQADGVDVTVISGVPSGAEVKSGELSMIADGLNIEFATDEVGAHTLLISAWPHMDVEVVVNAI